MAFKALLSYFSVNTSTQSSSSRSEYTFYGFFLSISEVKLRRFFIPLMKGALTQVLLKLFLRCEQIVQDFMLVNQLLK